MTPRWITLLTDFGSCDGYVASMKGVLSSLAPSARIVDAAHGLPPQDIAAGAWALTQYWSLFPEGTLHVAVVDPGVGTLRKGLLVEVDGRWLIGPDNGIFGPVMSAAERCVVRALRPDVCRPEGCSATFHGRDVFAYVAGLLAGGHAAADEVAETWADPLRQAWPEPRRYGALWAGEVIHVDHFGNLITNLTRSHLASDRTWSLRIGGLLLPGLIETYALAASGQPLALWGSTSHLEIAVSGGSAAALLGFQKGATVLALPTP